MRPSLYPTAALLAALLCHTAQADDHLLTLDPTVLLRQPVLWLSDAPPTPATPANPPAAQPSGGNLHLLPDQKELAEAPNRHTLFTGLIKDQSMYGKAWFPETLLVPEMDLEYQEGRVDFLHEEKHGHYFSEGKVEFEQAFGALTIEIELPWQHETVQDMPNGGWTRNEGFSRVEIGTRYPLFQLLSADANLDYTCVGAFEVAIPTHTDFSQDTEISPRIYQLFRMGDHFSIQTSTATEHLIGPDRGGTVTLTYGATFGYALYPEQLPIPAVLTTIPMVEVTGEHVLTGQPDGRFMTSNFGTAGIRFNMQSFGPIQPRVGLGYIFPLDQGARDQMHWGTLFTVVFEF